MFTRTSWIPVSATSDFSLQNLPFGIFSTPDRAPRPGIAIGEQILDLYALAEQPLWDEAFPDLVAHKAAFQQAHLNELMALGRPTARAIRAKLQPWLSDATSPLKELPQLLVKQASARMHMPVVVGDYTDFYSSIEHATNVGKMFRDPENALLPNWRHLPVGYHGRASSIVVSGTPIRRPHGQVMPKGADQPVFQPSARLDFELEMAFIVGKPTAMGTSVTPEMAEDHMFGLVVFNDWSARDIQKWEYVPLGPFLGKSFASSISPWVVTLDALEPFRVEGPLQQPRPLPYLRYAGKKSFDIQLEVTLQPQGGEATTICRSNFKHMYWTMAQQLAHHTVNGCNLRVGDIMASGTISGKEADSFGSMLELSWAGSKPLKLKGGHTRTFLEDHDTVSMRAHAEKDGIRVGFGEVSGQIMPAT